MFRTVLLASLALSILAAGAMRASSVALHSGRRNTLDFACGVVNPQTGSASIAKEDFTYSFYGLPPWLSAQGSTVYGVPPKGISGSYEVKVNYASRSGKGGEANVLLTVGGASDVSTVSKSNGEVTTVTYFSGANYRGNSVVPSAFGNYVVIVPVKQPSVVSTVTVSPAPVPAPVICTLEENNVALANAGVASTQTALDKVGNDIKGVNGDLAALANKRDDLGNQIVATQAQLDNTNGQINDATNKVNNLVGSLNDAQNARDAANTAAGNAANSQQAADAAKNDASGKKDAADAALNAANQAVINADGALKNAQDSLAQAKSNVADAQKTADQAAQTLKNDQDSSASASKKVADLRAALEAAIADETAAKNKADASAAADKSAKDAVAAANDAQTKAQSAADAAQASDNAARDQQSQAANNANTAAGNLQAANAALTDAQNKAQAAQDAAAAAQNAVGAAQKALNDGKTALGNLQNQKANQGNNLQDLVAALAATRAGIAAGSDKLAQLSALKERLKGQLAQALSNAGLSNQALQLCKARQAERDAIAAKPGVVVNVTTDNSCGERSESLSVVRGQGKITDISANSITIDNTTTIAVGTCTNVIHASGSRKPLKIADKITFDAIRNGGKTWARAISCSG